jgi:ankyrin repeat protein
MRRIPAVLIIFSLIAALVGAYFWHRTQARQDALDQRMILALLHHNDNQALSLVKQGAGPDTRDIPSKAPSLKEWADRLLHNSDVSTALMIACGAPSKDENNQDRQHITDAADLVEAMLQHGAKINVRDQYGWTPLMWAVGGHHVNIVRVLLNHGADAHLADKNGVTALMLARQNQGFEIEEMLTHYGARN